MIDEFPEGWAGAPIPSVFDFNPPKPAVGILPAEAPVSFVPMSAVDAKSGKVIEIETRPFGQVRKGYTAFRDDDVILAKITPCFENGKAAITRNLRNGLGFGSSEFCVFRPTGAVSPEYLFHYLRQERFRAAAADHMTGTAGQERVPAAYLGTVILPVPPLAEQGRIVVKIEELLNEVTASYEHLSRVPAILRRFRQSVLAAAYSGQLTATWRKTTVVTESAKAFLGRVESLRRQALTSKTVRYPEPESVDDDELPEVPESWLWASADAICSQVTDGEHIQPPYKTEGYPMLSAKHVREGFVTLDGAGLISKVDFEKALQRCKPENGDVLIVSVGATTGRTAIVENCPPFAIVRSVLLLKPLISSQLLLRWLQSSWCIQWMTQASGASAQPHLYIRDSKRLPVPIPPPAEQEEISRKVNILFGLVDAIEKRVTEAAARADKLSQSILDKAFRGELVPTEAELARQEGRDYEAASVLLERIARDNDGRDGKRTKEELRAAESSTRLRLHRRSVPRARDKRQSF
jgi:type I restriction enzyme, S subunit